MARTKQQVKKTRQNQARPKGSRPLVKIVAKKSVRFMPTKRKVQRYRPGVLALKEIRLFQRTTNLLIKKLPFQRLVKEVTQSIHPGMKMQVAAIMAIQVRPGNNHFRIISL